MQGARKKPRLQHGPAPEAKDRFRGCCSLRHADNFSLAKSSGGLGLPLGLAVGVVVGFGAPCNHHAEPAAKRLMCTLATKTRPGVLRATLRL
eukprot:7388495-Alexandrium_andersonii.AAC.1